MLNYPNSRLSAETLGRFSSGSVAARYGDYERAAPLRPQPNAPRAMPSPRVVWGQYNNYRSTGLKVSAMVHAAGIGLLLAGTLFVHPVTQVKPREVVTLIAPSPDSYTLHAAQAQISGGGGGGDRDPVPPPKGRLPKLAMEQVTPPQIVLRNEKPKLPVEATVMIPPQVQLAENHAPNLGLPTVAPHLAAPPSNGAGSGGGIGSGSGGGVGVGHGAGVGPGTGGGIGGGVFKMGAGIAAPRPLATPDPIYTEEARRAKVQGTCVLSLIVDAEGHPRDLRIVRGLGYGLDAKALEAVREWRFEPARKDGQPVNVQVTVEVGFHLY